MTETKKTETPTAEAETPIAEAKEAAASTEATEKKLPSFAERFAKAYEAAMKSGHAEASANEALPGEHADDGVVFMPGDDKWFPDGT
jgi:hypothetical protein